MSRALAILSLVLTLTVGFVGCGRPSTAQPELVEKVRQQVAKSLMKDAAQLDVGKSLGVQGADEGDIVNLLMDVEDAFKVEIPDSISEKTPREIAKTLTIQQIADVIAGQIEKQKR